MEENYLSIITCAITYSGTVCSAATGNGSRAPRSGFDYDSGVIDHTKRHNEPDTQETWRRVDPVKIIKEVEAAGFEFVDYSSLHYRPDDELIYDTIRPSINRYSDRFTLKFRKP